MAEKTKIEWASHTFNPWIGCAKVRCGCDNCYAEAMAGRLGVVWGPNGTRRRTAESTWRQVETWNRKAACNCGDRIHGDKIHHSACPQYDRPRVFPSLCDPFEDWGGWVLDSQGQQLFRGPDPSPDGYHSVSSMITMDDLRRDFFALIDRTQNLDWLLLTKRPENIRRMRSWKHPHSSKMRDERRDNVWLLYSASDQASMEAGLPRLLACRDLSPVLGLSLEPLVGPVDLTKVRFPHGETENVLDCRVSEFAKRCGIDKLAGVDWVIVGGESGPRARPCNVAWIRSIVSQCREAGVPCFVKQLGANIECIDVIDAADHFPGTVRLSEAKRPNARVHLRDPKGGDPSEWPEYLRVREIPRVVSS